MQPGVVLVGLVLGCLVGLSTPALPGSLDSPCASSLSGCRVAVPNGSSEGTQTLLRLRGGHPAEEGGALAAPLSLGTLLGRVGEQPAGRGAGMGGDQMVDFDINTLQPACLPPLRPRLRRRHGRTAPSGKGDVKKGASKNVAVLATKTVPAGAQAAAAEAAVAAQTEAWDDVVSHVSASAGVASHVSASAGAFMGMPAAMRPDKPYATVGNVRDFSGLFDSHMDETTDDERDAMSDKFDKPPDTATDAKTCSMNKGVDIGDVLNTRFSLVGLLGAGAFGQVFLAEDILKGGHVAIKVQGAGNFQSQVAQDEIALLNVVANCRACAPLQQPSQLLEGETRTTQLLPNDTCDESDVLPHGGECVVELKGSFALNGPQGKQVCLALEPLGPSLLDLVIDHSYGGCRLSVVAHIMRDVLAGLDFLHTQCKIIHTDVKPENVLLTIPPAGGRGSASDWWASNRESVGEGVDKAATQRLRMGWSSKWSTSSHFRAKLVDLGNACPEARPFTDDIQTIEYRCPEVVLGAGFNSKADLWSAACMAFELITGEYLFDPQEGRDSEGTTVVYERDEDLLALQQELLGVIPLHLAVRGKMSQKLMTDEGRLRRIPSLKFWNLEDVLVDKYCVPKNEAAEIAEFLLPMLKYDPEDRASAAEMLRHPWLLKHLKVQDEQ